MRNFTLINDAKTTKTETPADDVIHFDDCGELKVGTIMVSSWGYDQTNIDFYVVTRRTKSTVDITPIASDVAPTGTWGVSKVNPLTSHYFDILDQKGTSPIKGKRIRFESDKASRTSIKIDSYRRAYIWDGTTQTETSGG